MLAVASGEQSALENPFAVPEPTVAITLVGGFSAMGPHWRVFVYHSETEYYHDSANSKERAEQLAREFVEQRYMGLYLQRKAEQDKRHAGGKAQ